MKVRCKSRNNIYNNLTIGREYIVWAIEFYDKEKSVFSQELGDFVAYRLDGDDNSVSCYPAGLFEIVSNKIPVSWVPYREESEDYSILPSSWARKYFWANYYDDEINAVTDFQIEKKKMFVDELSATDIETILNCGDLSIVSFMIDALILAQDDRAKDIAIRIADSDKFISIWEVAFKYLIKFKEERVLELFLDFLMYNEKRKPNIAKIVNEYLNENNCWRSKNGT